MAETVSYQVSAKKGKPTFFQTKVTYTNIASNQETTIQFPSALGQRVWNLVSLQFNRTGGSAATYTISIGNASGFTTLTGDELLLGTSTAVATPTHDTYVTSIPMWADSDYRLYLKPGFVSDSDNDGTAELIFASE
jgi:hypothetical protein|tara:strand:- start:16 stop:423 length:408 start_codon:yes stop_codon:yes gene_type:complete